MVIALIFGAIPGLVVAHEVRPAFLELIEGAPGEFDVLWKVPALGGPSLAGEEIPHETLSSSGAWPPVGKEGAPASIIMPCGCPAPTAAQLARAALPIHPSMPGHAVNLTPPSVQRLPGAEIRRWTIDTGTRGLDGWNVSVHGLSSTMVDVLVRVAFADGRVVSRLLRPDSPSFILDR